MRFSNQPPIVVVAQILLINPIIIIVQNVLGYNNYYCIPNIWSFLIDNDGGLFLVDGIPSGLITAEVMNWKGRVTVALRSQLADLQPSPCRILELHNLTNLFPQPLCGMLLFTVHLNSITQAKSNALRRSNKVGTSIGPADNFKEPHYLGITEK